MIRNHPSSSEYKLSLQGGGIQGSEKLNLLPEEIQRV